MKNLAPPAPKDRFDVYRFFNGMSAEAKEGLDATRLRIPLVKTFLLEYASCRDHRESKTPADIFREIGAEVKMLDERFMGLAFRDATPSRDSAVETTGYLEQFDERFFAYYTCEDSDSAKKRVSKWVQSPALDHTWFSSPLLQALWDHDISTRGDHRFSRLRFRHESIFDMPEDFSAPDDQAEDQGEDADTDVLEEENHGGDDRTEVERRKASFVMRDRIGAIKGALNNLQRHYSPLYALSALSFPSRTGRGGNELFQTGQITNRTDSFEEHRNTVRYLYRIYKAILNETEQHAWPNVDAQERLQVNHKGVPLIVEFAEPLSEATFNRWVQMAFQKRNRFKLWGNPIRLGPTKVHVYGADRHLWHPIDLELTAKGLVAILPQGTCGNTFHRLVTNIQHYVCPKIRAWIGSQRFEDLVSKWPAEAECPNED